jgi:hypothetical protein
VVDSGKDLGVSGEGEVDDGVQGVMERSRAWSASSFASGNGAGRRLETSRASVKLGRGRTRRFAAVLEEAEESGGASGHRKWEEAKRRRRSHPWAPDLTTEAVSTRGLRR